VPAQHGPALVEALLHLYQAKAEALHQRANDLIRGDGSAEALRRTRHELYALDQAIERFGWDPAMSERPAEVTAGRAVMGEAIRVAIDDAGERLSELCTSLLRGEGSLTELRSQFEALGGLLELLREAQGE
jgi:hypothetical protein